MWAEVKSKKNRDTLTQDYLARKNRLRQHFEDERLGKVTLLDEASKLFEPITSAVSKAHQQETAEVKKVTDALERLPAQIATEANFNPIAALFGVPKAATATSRCNRETKDYYCEPRSRSQRRTNKAAWFYTA